MAGTLTVQNIEGPSSGSDANTILIPSGQKLHAPGHVVQCKEHSWSTSHTISTTTLTQVTDSSFSFTPVFGDSRLLVNMSVFVNPQDNAGQAGGGFQLYKDGSALTSFPAYMNYMDIGSATGVDFYDVVCPTWGLDATSTSSMTFSLYARMYTSDDTRFGINVGTTSVSRIVVWEIAQ